MAHQRIFVVGGSGFLGWEVVSISPSGRPFTTPAGHRPGWSTSPLIRWQSADALRPETYADELRSCTAVVHTIGILLESDYKGGRSRAARGAQESGAGGGLLQGLLKGWGFGSGNPLNESAGKLSYEVMNRDSALSVARAFIESRTGTCPLTSTPTSTSAPFVYISAEDIFRPIVSERYIKTKREAEYELARLALDSLNASSSSSSTSLSSLATAAAKEPVIRPFYAVCAAIAGEAQEQRIGLSVTAQVEAREAPISVGEVLATSDIRRLAGWKS
ncbi:unnamed protein product [Tilletia caries]|nr:unnamed protein product [Tilletia caries]